MKKSHARLALAAGLIALLIIGAFAVYFFFPKGGDEDGLLDVARFRNPDSVAVDAAGTLYVADTSNHTIRKITSAGVKTLAGQPGALGNADGNGNAARFYYPHGLALDTRGTIYVADTWNHTIRKIMPSGAVTTFAGMPGMPGSHDGSGSAARFSVPFAVATDRDGNVYVADEQNSAIRKITPAGEVSTLAGSAGKSGNSDGKGSAARFAAPRAVAADSGGNIYVADTGNHTIRKITPAGEVTTLAGLAGSFGSAEGSGSSARFHTPIGVATDADDNIYVGDTYNHVIRKITPAGAVSTLAGRPRFTGSSDGTGSSARFRFPVGIATDSARNVYVADYHNHMIRKITPSGVVTTVAGVVGPFDRTRDAARELLNTITDRFAPHVRP